MHLPSPCTSTVEFPSLLGFSAKLSPPSSCSFILLSFAAFAVLGLLVTLKFLYLGRKSRSRSSEVVNKAQKSEKEQIQVQTRTWRSLLSGWDAVNLPVTLSAASPTTTVVGRGVGLNGAVLAKQVSSPTRSGPAFEQPLPAIYQSKEPMSMAKMIMSRHTFRRPTQQKPPPTPRRSVSLPQSSRPQSMV